jgi:branched-chain amino acid transport system ATP-binding protein
VLRLNKLHAHYGNVHALKEISIEVREGELVTLVGANGAGKSTALRVISGLLRPTSGSVELNGERIDGMAPHHILARGICQVPEGRQLFGDLTVIENLEMGGHAAPKAEFERRVQSVLDYFPVLADRRRQLARTLSGGEQQMLAIGRGLMSAPKMLLLDEPSLGLAPIVVDKLAEIIQALHERGITILLVEQNAYMALELADRGYVLQTGSIVLHDEGRKLLENEEVKRAYLGI